MSKYIRGDLLPPNLKDEVLRKYIYRWTTENPQRVMAWGQCPKCDIKEPYVNATSSDGHSHPTIPLIGDSDWLAQHSFKVTERGELDQRSTHAEPAFMAEGARRTATPWMPRAGDRVNVNGKAGTVTGEDMPGFYTIKFDEGWTVREVSRSDMKQASRRTAETYYVPSSGPFGRSVDENNQAVTYVDVAVSDVEIGDVLNLADDDAEVVDIFEDEETLQRGFVLDGGSEVWFDSDSSTMKQAKRKPVVFPWEKTAENVFDRGRPQGDIDATHVVTTIDDAEVPVQRLEGSGGYESASGEVFYEDSPDVMSISKVEAASFSEVEDFILNEYGVQSADWLLDIVMMENPDASLEDVASEYAESHSTMASRAGEPQRREAGWDDFWGSIDLQIEQLSKAKSADEVISILSDEGHGVMNSGQGFFAGSGGDGSVMEALSRAGWRLVWAEADYYFAMQAPDGSGITYVEGDVYKGIQSQARKQRMGR